MFHVIRKTTRACGVPHSRPRRHVRPQPADRRDAGFVVEASDYGPFAVLPHTGVGVSPTNCCGRCLARLGIDREQLYPAYRAWQGVGRGLPAGASGEVA